MNAKEIISSISEDCFLREPLLFDVLCSHKIEVNEAISAMFRTGKRRIEYNPRIVEENAGSAKDALTTEMYRILLKHPYERVSSEPNRVALKKSSDIAISESCYPFAKPHDLLGAKYYNLEEGQSYEEYYKKN